MAMREIADVFTSLSDEHGSMRRQDLEQVLANLDAEFWDETAVGKLLHSMGCREKEDLISLSSFLQALNLTNEAMTDSEPPGPGDLLSLPSEAPRDFSHNVSGKAYLNQHGLSWPSEVDLKYIQRRAVVQKLSTFIQRLLFMKPYDIERFAVDYFSGTLSSQKRLLLISSDVEDKDVLRAAVRTIGMGSEILTAEWDFQSVPAALSATVDDLLREHGTFKTVAMCCHGSTDLVGFATGAELDAALHAMWQELGKPDLAGGMPDMETPLAELKQRRGLESKERSGRWMLTATHGIDMDTGHADSGVEEAILDVARAASVRLDILACKLADTQMCESLINRWQQKTRTNIAASVGLMGNADSGGNWELETDDINVARTYFDEAKLSQWCGCLTRSRSVSGMGLSEPQKQDVAHGLVESLDRNGTGILEEFEWAQGCRWARHCLQAKPNPAVAATIFNKVDVEGTGAIHVENIVDNLPDVLRALGVPTDQALEGMHMLRDQRAREGNGDASILDLMVRENAKLEDTHSDAGSDDANQTQKQVGQQTPWEPLLPRRGHDERKKAQDVACRCSARRSQILRQFLGMLEPQGTLENPARAAAQGAEHAVPLAVRAKKAAWQAVASSEPLPLPPADLDLSFDLDSLYAGGENLWVAAGIGIGKKDLDQNSSFDMDHDDAKQQALVQRAPADLLVVVDVSSSMGSALPSVRNCLASLVALTEAQDRLALVKFDDTADCVLPWTAMDAEGCDAFKAAQRDLSARGGTCYLPVLKMCLGDLLEDEVPSRTRSMLFISDGHPSEQDIEILKLICEQNSSPNLNIVTAGFGSSVKANLMSSVAQAGCGPFVYIHDEKSIPEQLGRIWAAVAYTSVCASFLIVRPLAGARVTAVEGAFGTAELCLRPDGQKSEQQVMLMQVGPVRHGILREVAFRLNLPPSLQRRPLTDNQLRAPLVEVSLLVETVARTDYIRAPVFMRTLDFLPLQVPSLLGDNLVPFPMRLVLENDLDQTFEPETCLRQVAQTLGINACELELNRVLAGSIIVDFRLKLQPERAAQVLKDVKSSAFQANMRKEIEKLGYQMKSVKTPGQQAFRRLLQMRFAGALGIAAAASHGTTDVPELRTVKQLASSDLAESLDPPGPSSVALAVVQDCTTVLTSIAETADKKGDEKKRRQHDMLQMQAAHLAQFKCQSIAASLQAYEVKEARVAAASMERACEAVRVTSAFLDSTSENVELRSHPGADDHVGVFLLLRPRFGTEDDFGYLTKALCPTFQVTLTAEDDASDSREACAYPVHANSMLPVCIKSNHPTTLHDRCGGKVTVPYAHRLKISVDSRSCVGGSLSFYVDCTAQKPFKVIHHANEPIACQKPDTFFVKGADIWYTYEHAKGANFDQIAENWGFEFEVQIADDTDVRATERCPRGMLLQARFAGVTPGSYNISAHLSPQVFEVAPSTISTCELAGGAEELAAMLASTDGCLQLTGAATLARGLRSPSRLLGINGSGANSKAALCDFARAIPKKDTMQATILTSMELNHQSIAELENDKLAKVPDERWQRFIGNAVVKL
mmetsp:Transcript_12555/g.24524  ORF Transcript_12555/g.24524 Transcript_12555/m.24524 type:complete len:1551 (-) Transcript_12555:259-4911(-)